MAVNRWIGAGALIIVLAGSLLLPQHAAAQAKLSLEFPEVDGWAKGTRYEQPVDPTTSISYTTKDKVGSDYIRVQVQAAPAASLAEALAAAEKKVLNNPIHKKMAKKSTTEFDAGKDSQVTLVTFTSELSGRPHETELYAFVCGDHVVRVDHNCLATDAKRHSAEVGKLVKAIVAAADKAK
jgi:hypothetical protein